MDKRIPIFRPNNKDYHSNLSLAVERVFNRDRYVLAEEVDRFERAFADYCGVSYCVGVANGTDALELALRALEVKREEVVALVANAGFYGSTAVHKIGARPVYVDVDPATLTMSPEQLDLAWRENPKAVIVTHLYGQLADIEAIMEMAAKRGVPVVEDCAQAHGAERNGRRAGSFGTFGCFSFYPTKNLGAAGDGGAVVTEDETMARRLRQLRQYGWEKKYVVASQGGGNSRLDEIQAAILSEKLPHLDGWNAMRRAIAGRYDEAFSALPVTCPQGRRQDHVVHLYVLRVDRRDAFRGFLAQRGVATDVHYPLPDHLQPAYACAQPRGALPVTESCCDSVVSLPCFPGLGADEAEHVVDAVRSYFRHCGE